MGRRARIVWFGGAALLVIAGGACGAAVGGGTGQLLALVLISLGFVLATSLLFLEVGLSEDRARARERRAAMRRRRSRIERSRGHRRRLR